MTFNKFFCIFVHIVFIWFGATVECLPNIVVLFADNLGYGDIGVFGAPTARTPNIDSLASQGLKLNNWNSAAHLCSASRAALLTGRYPVRSGVYPAVFKPDAANGLSPEEVTIAEYLKEKGYATSIVGKWHLGHREDFLPTNQGFDEWFGIPYHMSGGSIDDHVCGFDHNETMWLPLFNGTEIVEQPVDLRFLAQRYSSRAQQFMKQSVSNDSPFFLYVPFSHVHQLCAPQQAACQWASNQFSFTSPHGNFEDAVEEMDWIAGEILSELENLNIVNDTLVLFTSDNGPWVAEQSCSGSKGPFEGRWLRDNVHENCTACPHDYIPSPTPDRPRRCIYPGKENLYQLDGVHCGEDTGLGGIWEANLRMPALARWPGQIPAGSETMSMVSTLDVLPTILNIAGINAIPSTLDGVDITNILFQNDTKSIEDELEEERVLFFWRDGFEDGPLPSPYGRFDVVAAKLGRFKAWFYTKSAHYNADIEVFHDPPLLFDTMEDPAEAFPLEAKDHTDVIQHIRNLVEKHKSTVDWVTPLTVARDPRFIPCVDQSSNCRTHIYDTFDRDNDISSVE
jgi:arylsulfatase A